MRAIIVLLILMASACVLVACSTDYPYAGAYPSPYGGQVPGWGGAATCPSC
jgi:hypothetical protein